MVEVRAICRFYVVFERCFFFLFGEAFQHPGHVAANVAHGLHPFQIFAYFVRRHAMDHVPICRSDDGHAGNAEIFLNDIDDTALTLAFVTADAVADRPGP